MMALRVGVQMGVECTLSNLTPPAAIASSRGVLYWVLPYAPKTSWPASSAMISTMLGSLTSVTVTVTSMLALIAAASVAVTVTA